MKWVFASVLVVVLGAVAGFAIYAYGWRDGSDDQAALARLYGERVRDYYSLFDLVDEVGKFTHVGGDVWQAEVTGAKFIDVRTFDYREDSQVDYVDITIEGFHEGDCLNGP